MYVVDAKFEQNVNVFVVFEHSFKFYDVGMRHFSMNLYFALQFFLQLTMRKSVLVDYFAGISDVCFLVSDLVAFSKTALS